MTDPISLYLFVRRASLERLLGWYIQLRGGALTGIKVTYDKINVTSMGSMWVQYAPGPPRFWIFGEEMGRRDLEKIILDELARSPVATEQFCESVRRDIKREREERSYGIWGVARQRRQRG